RYGQFPGLNFLLGIVFGLKRWLRGHRGALGAATPAAAGEPKQPVPERLLASVRPALAVRYITNSVHRARIVALRRRNYMELARRFSGMTGARALAGELPENAAPYVFPLYVEDPAASYQRLRAAGVPIFRWDEIWSGTPAIENDHGLDWATHVFQLGCHQDLSLQDIAAIAETVKRTIEGPARAAGGEAVDRRQAPSERNPAGALRR